MRVIGGRFRSRLLLAPSGMGTRPTTDRLRETLMNVLTQGAVDHVMDAAVLDLYAGSGAVGIEALSRGAARAVLVEEGAGAAGFLRKNLRTLGLEGEAAVEVRSAAAYLRRAVDAGTEFGVIFLDPPYEAREEYRRTLLSLGGEAGGLLAPGGVVVAEHRRKEPLEAQYGGLVRFRVLEQGDAALSFYSKADASAMDASSSHRICF